jgi:hypothetical protein
MQGLFLIPKSTPKPNQGLFAKKQFKKRLKSLPILAI